MINYIFISFEQVIKLTQVLINTLHTKIILTSRTHFNAYVNP